MLIRSIQLKNFLSYGPATPPLELKNLNVIIGPNGSGKSNLLEALALLRSTPQELVRPIRMGGSVREWLWKGDKTLPTASLEIVVDKGVQPHIFGHLGYRIAFTEQGKRFAVVDEKIAYADPAISEPHPPFLFEYRNNGTAVFNVSMNQKDWTERELHLTKLDPEKSILAQRYEPDMYPEVSYIADSLKEIAFYRDWSFGPSSSIRLPQRFDAQGGYLAEDMSNLARILSKYKRDGAAKVKLLEFFRSTYEGLDDVDVDVDSGEIYVREGGMTIPAIRLSDGTLRALCLLTVLCDPEPPKLVCIDEPELGLHPDLINSMAGALRYAAERTQVIVTTHSIGLVDAFNDTPETVIVCEKQNNCTTMSRLDSQDLAPWLEDYRLGDLWSRGYIGGNRW